MRAVSPACVTFELPVWGNRPTLCVPTLAASDVDGGARPAVPTHNNETTRARQAVPLHRPHDLRDVYEEPALTPGRSDGTLSAGLSEESACSQETF